MRLRDRSSDAAPLTVAMAVSLRRQNLTVNVHHDRHMKIGVERRRRGLPLFPEDDTAMAP
jgi:hypothetical protein